MNDDEELAKLARDRHRATYAELEQEKKMQDPIVIPPEEEEPPLRGCRWLFFGIAAFWAVVIIGVALLWSCQAEAGTQVYLESERDLGNGFKLCIYSEGVTITRPSHQLCPISIEV